eukprot:TRINITY_DN2378_c0_g1_i1.p1 TRINITY_DN2378_c0_g1~~TRINITY_DN2378_c0_g1_i1.p1  ORF type:complete len:262 (-),score=26.44 TRINITY_DN2378_c0_g1_i1:167-952(-)
MCDQRSRKRQFGSGRLSRDEIEQFYAGLAQTELNQEPDQTKLQWWSEISPGELRFQCSFKRPSIEAVDEVVRRLSGDSPDFAELGGPSMETVVHRISVDMEDLFGRRPSMEELAAGISIVSSNPSPYSTNPAPNWCDERMEMMAHNERDRDLCAIPWDRGGKRPHNRTVISASIPEDSAAQSRRRSFGKDGPDQSAELSWLRQSSSAAILALQGSPSWQRNQTVGTGTWEPSGDPFTMQNKPPKTTIKAQATLDDSAMSYA